MVMISALDRKLLRDLMQMKGQSLAIALVMACGVATFVMSLMTLRSLRDSQAAYYTQYRFADVFAQVKRAPIGVADEIADIPGVAAVQPRIVADVTLDVADMDEPATGRLISVPDAGRPLLNDLHLRRGRYLESGRAGEALVSEAFALAHNLEPGDTVRAVINGRLQTLRLVGVALSPEYVLSLEGGAALPDDRRFGVFWMAYEELAAAFDMDGAFNDIAVSLVPGTSVPQMLRLIDRLTERYGAVGAHDREDQLSHRFLSDEIRGLRGIGLIVPMIFLGVAAFLLNVVMSRLIATQREQIATLKAFGYGRLEIAIHYLKFVLVISIVGAILGTAVGIRLAQGLTALYAQFYKFPSFVFSVRSEVAGAGLLVAAGAAVAGTLGSVRRAVILPAAQAMRPEPPPNFRPTVVERLGLAALFTQPARMVLRQLERRPLKAAFSVLGISMAVAILVMGGFMNDALDHMIDYGFYTQQRQDISIAFREPTSAAAIHEVARLPGVSDVQPLRSVPVRLRSGHLHRRGVITGIPREARLLRVIDEDMRAIDLPAWGLVFSDMLAKLMDVRVGQSVRVELMEGERREFDVPVMATVREYAGTNMYMDIEALHQLLQEDATLSAAFLTVDAQAMPELYSQLKRTPRVASVSVKQTMVQSFMDTQAENQRVMQRFNMAFACIIAAGVVYNTARISLAERGRELATLRVIGFTRTEISAILLGELAVLTVLAIPVGMVLGYGFSALVAMAFESESYRIPLVVGRRTFGLAALVVIVAAFGSGLLVRRRLDHLDLVAVLKAKE